MYHPKSLSHSKDYDLNHYSDFYSETIPEIEEMFGCTSNCTKSFTLSDKSQLINGHYATKTSGTDNTAECEKLSSEAGYDGFIVCLVKKTPMKNLDYASVSANVADFTMTNEKSCQHGPRKATFGIITSLPFSVFKNKAESL